MCIGWSPLKTTITTKDIRGLCPVGILGPCNVLLKGLLLHTCRAHTASRKPPSKRSSQFILEVSQGRNF